MLPIHESSDSHRGAPPNKKSVEGGPRGACCSFGFRRAQFRGVGVPGQVQIQWCLLKLARIQPPLSSSRNRVSTVFWVLPYYLIWTAYVVKSLAPVPAVL